MAVRPIQLNTDGTLEVYHDDAEHGGQVALDAAQFNSTLGERINYAYLSLCCPICHATSVHPISGGCDPVNVQRLFLEKFRRDEISERAVWVPNDFSDTLAGAMTFAQAKLLCKQMIVELAGDQYWKLEDVSD